MSTEIKLPQFGMGMSEATIVRWLKGADEPVTAGEPLVEVESAKAVNEIAAPATGVLRAIKVAEGEIAQVYDVLGVIAEANTPQGPMLDGTLASPRARRVARDLGVDLRTLNGTGSGGRITDDDVRKAADFERTESRETAARPDAAQPLTGMRASIAKHVFQSLQQSAQLTLTRSIDVTNMVAMKETLQGEATAGYNDVIVKAVALALREHRSLNASYTAEGVVHHSDIDIGVAVAVQDGLLVPIVRRADQLSLANLAAEIRCLRGLARANRLGDAELRGGSFSVSNLGSYDIDAFTPIINMPQVAILGVGRIADCFVKRLGTAVWRHQMTVSLTFDHRVVDGAPAAEFLRSLADLCDRPSDLG